MQGAHVLFFCLLASSYHLLDVLQLVCFGVPQGSVRIWAIRRA